MSAVLSTRMEVKHNLFIVHVVRIEEAKHDITKAIAY